jgi:lipid II:glycine glycyltransferase (peptidoglycan interpeptide bridge formation enzyme)
MNIKKDIRQSVLWGEYLSKFGWHNVLTKNEIRLSVCPTLLGSLIKVQRPHLLTKEDLSEIDEIAAKEKALIVKLEPMSKQDEDLLKENGFQYSRFPQCPPSTMYIDLHLSQEDLWSRLSHSAKYSINRSRREKDVTEFFQNPSAEILAKFYRIAKETARTKKFYIMPISDYIARIEVFKDKSYIALSKDVHGEITGGKFFLEDGGLVLYVSGGTSSEARKHKSGYLLTWDSIIYFKDKGLDVMDLEGMDDKRFPNYTKDWGGFSHFKEKFGGEVVQYPVPYIKYYSPLMRILTKFAPLSL